MMDVFDLRADHWLRVAHNKSIHHRVDIKNSDKCGCFHCLKSFAPAQISDWTDGPETVKQTALCPFCGIDSVIGDAPGFTITSEFLAQMQEAWFGNLDD